MKIQQYFYILTFCCYCLVNVSSAGDNLRYRASPKLTGPAKFAHASDDLVLNKLDAALEQLTSVYMQALFSGTHTPEMELHMRGLEIDLFNLLNELYKQNRMRDYMKYESEVTQQMIIYNMLKKLFGYATDDNEKVN